MSEFNLKCNFIVLQRLLIFALVFQHSINFVVSTSDLELVKLRWMNVNILPLAVFYLISHMKSEA
jgi:hypothetical protein